MAKTKPQTDEPRETEGATSTAKKAKSPSKKQATKKTAKKPAKKTSTRSSTPRVSKKRSSKKPAKKQATKKTAKKPAKKTAKKPVKKAKKPAQKSKKPVKKAEIPAAQEERTVISSPPSRQRREQVQAKASVEQNRKEAETAQTPQDVQPEEMQWGRRTRRSAPIGWEDRAGVSTPVQPTRRQDANAENQPVEASGVSTPVQPTRQQNADTEEKTVQASAKPARTETPAQSKRDEPKKEDTRKVSRPPKGRNQSNQSNQNKQRPSKRSSDRNRSQKPEQPSNRLTQILAQSWTEDKTRQFISEGFLGSLSPELVNNGKSETIPDAEKLKEPLKMIRKVLADECMVADDVTDLMLLDVVMNALSDRIDVCRLQAESNALSDIDAILELRYKADRRLIEAVNALKNA